MWGVIFLRVLADTSISIPKWHQPAPHLYAPPWVHSPGSHSQSVFHIPEYSRTQKVLSFSHTYLEEWHPKQQRWGVLTPSRYCFHRQLCFLVVLFGIAMILQSQGTGTWEHLNCVSWKQGLCSAPVVVGGYPLVHYWLLEDTHIPNYGPFTGHILGHPDGLSGITFWTKKKTKCSS